VSNGTAALHIALAAIGVKSGDEVVIPTFTMMAAANSATYQGARAVLVDSEMDTWNIDPSKIEEKITDKTKAIVVVHLYGHPAKNREIAKIAEDYGVYLVEDAAEAHGAEYYGKKVGSLGNMSCFSFYANKIVTTGEGGMVLTDDSELANRLRKLRDQAYSEEFRKQLIHDEIGFNYRLTNVQAAIGLAQVERIDEFITRHREIAHLYSSMLSGLKGLVLPPEAIWAKNVYWMYTILLDGAALTRDELMLRLQKEFEIETRTTFYPIHLQPAYKNAYKDQRYPVAEALGKTGLNLPSGNSTTLDEVKYVANAIRTILEDAEAC
jgi:perosamine synthetase